MERIGVVDERNRFVRWEERRRAHEKKLLHRSAQVLVFDTPGRLLIQRRAATKQVCPGHWDTSVSGHVDEGDYPAGLDQELDGAYRRAAARELSEELGVSAELGFLAHFAPEPGIHYEHYHLYRAVHDGPFVFPASEIEEIRHVDRAGFDALVGSGDRVTPLLARQVEWLEEEGLWP